jgi:23S rRNA pseudouridine2605 synthase
MGKVETSGKIRLNRFLALCGVTSRRGADQLINEGQVALNGKRVYELGSKVDPTRDKVTVAGRPVGMESKNVYFLFYKPKGVLSTMSDPSDRQTISHFTDQIRYRLFPVGRLDYDSEGLIILTNDGDYSQKLGHSKLEIPRTYLVKLKFELSEDQIKKLSTGVTLPGGKSKALRVEKVAYGSKEHPWYRVTLTDSKNEQLRKMFENFYIDILKLKRISIGQLKIGKMNAGELMEISADRAQLAFRTQKVMDFGHRLKSRAQRQKSLKRVKDSGHTTKSGY